MGYFSRLAVELLEENRGREDRELIEEEKEEPTTNQELAIEFQEAQYSLWNEQYRRTLEERTAATQKETPKVYQKNKRPQ